MAKKKSTFGKLLAFTTAVAAIGGTCYIFRDKIRTCPLYQKASDKLCSLKDSISDKFGDNDDFCFDDDFEDTSKDIFADNEHGREYTSITINAKEQTADNTTAEDTESSDTDKAQATAENSDTTEIHTMDDNLEVSNSNSDKEENTLQKEDMAEITNDTDAAEPKDSIDTAKEADIPVLEDVIPTISFDNPFSSSGIMSEDKEKEHTGTIEVSGYENEGLSDVSEDPDVLEEQDKLDF